MQKTVMCPDCARLLTIKVAEPPEQTLVVCPTCGWKGKMDQDGNLIPDEEPSATQGS